GPGGGRYCGVRPPDQASRGASRTTGNEYATNAVGRATPVAFGARVAGDRIHGPAVGPVLHPAHLGAQHGAELRQLGGRGRVAPVRPPADRRRGESRGGGADPAATRPT